VHERFVVPGHGQERRFIPAGLDDNPHIDRAEYEMALAELDETTQDQLLRGLWVTDPGGKPFKRVWWRGKNRYDRTVSSAVISRWISWDTAFKDKNSSDYSAYLVAELMADYRLRLKWVRRERLTFPELPEEMEIVAEVHNRDGRLSGVLIEDRASGTSAYQTLAATAPEWLREILVPFQPRGSKLERARQAGVWCKRGCVLMPRPGETAPWLYDFAEELFNFPDVAHDDRVDALSQLILYLEYYLAEGWRAREAM
jgi:predicted phage terminase large subunit-like protein